MMVTKTKRMRGEMAGEVRKWYTDNLSASVSEAKDALPRCSLETIYNVRSQLKREGLILDGRLNKGKGPKGQRPSQKKVKKVANMIAVPTEERLQNGKKGALEDFMEQFELQKAEQVATLLDMYESQHRAFSAMMLEQLSNFRKLIKACS